MFNRFLKYCFRKYFLYMQSFSFKKDVLLNSLIFLTTDRNQYIKYILKKKRKFQFPVAGSCRTSWGKKKIAVLRSLPKLIGSTFLFAEMWRINILLGQISFCKRRSGKEVRKGNDRRQEFTSEYMKTKVSLFFPGKYMYLVETINFLIWHLVNLP